MAEEQKPQETPAEETKEEKSPIALESGEQVKNKEKEQLKDELELYKNRAAKWQRKHDELKTQQPEPQDYQPTQPATDPLASLREQYDTDPFTATVGMVDRAGRHYYSQAKNEVKKEQKAKRVLRRSYKDFDEYEDRVDEFMEKMSPEKRTPDMFEMAYKVAKTEKIEDIEKIREEAKEEGKKEGAEATLENAQEIHAAATPRGTAPKETKTAVRLTPDEEKMAARYGMSNEVYAKWKSTKEITGGTKARLEK